MPDRKLEDDVVNAYMEILREREHQFNEEVAIAKYCLDLRKDPRKGKSDEELASMYDFFNTYKR